MAKNAEPIVAKHDIKAGEAITVPREQGFLYYWDGEGNALRSKQARNKLSDSELKKRVKEAAARNEAYQKRLAESARKKLELAQTKAKRAEERAANAAKKAQDAKAILEARQ
jgi:hypothetical protein